MGLDLVLPSAYSGVLVAVLQWPEHALGRRNVKETAPSTALLCYCSLLAKHS